MNATQCSQTEILAGAIALGEASDAERDDYRRHLAACGECVAAIGGEREIERTMQLVAAARDAESWEPDIRAALRAGQRGRRRSWRLAAAVVSACAILAIGTNAVLRAGGKDVATQRAVNVAYQEPKASSDRRTPAKAAARVQPRGVPEHRLVVVHNTVTLRPATSSVPPAAAAPKSVVARAEATRTTKAHAAIRRPLVVAALTPSERDRRSVAALRTGGTAPPPDPHAESIAVIPSTVAVRDVFPLGGENAIVPHPTAIAYSENAEGTTAFQVSVDEHGAPVKCTITKPSGYLVLDEAVCRAAMHARYSPRTINGRPVPSSYSDAFTFRSRYDQ